MWAAVAAAVSVATAAAGADSAPDSGAGLAEEDAEVADGAARWLLLRRRAWRELPEAPRPPTVTSDASNGLSASWDIPDHSPTPVVGYDIEYRAQTATVFAQWSHTGMATTTVITGLPPSTTYLVRVRAINDAGSGDWSEPGTGTTSNASPVFLEGLSTTRVVLENTPADRNVGLPVAATDAEDQTLIYGLGGPDERRFGIVAESGQLRTLQGVDYDHEADADYEVTVTAEDTQGGRAAIEVQIRVSDVLERPGRPDAPMVVASSPTSVRVSWTVPSNLGPPITDYDHRYRVAASNRAWTEITDTASAATQTEVAGLVGGTTYEVQVRASSDEGTSAWSASGTGAPSRMNVPPSFREGDAASRRVAENAPAGRPVGLPILATDPDGNVLTYGLQGADGERFELDTTSGQLSTRAGVVYDHEASTRHRFVVTVDDGVGGRDDIAVSVHITDLPEPPDEPNAPIVRRAGPDGLAVQWTAPDNAGRPPITGYRIRYGSGGAFAVRPGTVAHTQVSLSGLPAATYAVQVLARNDEGDSGWSASGYGVVGNAAPVRHDDGLQDVDVTIGGTVEVVPLDEAFTDPDGDPLTFGVSSTDESIVLAKLDGSVATVEAVAAGTANVEIVATDPQRATVTGDFEVTASMATLADLAVGYRPSDLRATIEFSDSFAPFETRAYRLRIRQASPRGDWRRYCLTVGNTGDQAGSYRIEGSLAVGTFVRRGTTYELDYRYMGGAACDAGTVPGPWSRASRLVVPPAGKSDFGIDLVFVGDEPAATHKALMEDAVELWETIITNDVIDIDFATRPIPADDCLKGQPEFTGLVDDLRIYVGLEPIDGAGGTLASAGFCRYRTPSGFPVVSQIRFDADDLDGLGEDGTRRVMLHEIAHALGFGLSWRPSGLLENPSFVNGEKVSPPPDTHFTGSNAVAAFEAAGGTDYDGGKVPVENEFGGSGGQDNHWRKSVMGSEIMTWSLGDTATFSAISIQSMADLGYSVDISQADAYTLPNLQGDRVDASAAAADRQFPKCVVRPLDDAVAVPEPTSEVLWMWQDDPVIEVQAAPE